MMPFDVSEKCRIVIEEYPFADILKQKLLVDMESTYFTNPKSDVIRAQMTSYETQSKNISRLTNWIRLVTMANYNIKYRLEFYNCWFVKYGMGDCNKTHFHHPGSFSFVYFIQTPRGSSPLVLTTSGKKIKAQEGKVIIFPSNVRHHVPKNRCDGRITLAGNCTHVPPYYK